MLRINHIVQDRERFIKGMKTRGVLRAEEIVDRLFSLNEKRKQAQKTADHLANKRKRQATLVAELSSKREKETVITSAKKEITNDRIAYKNALHVLRLHEEALQEGLSELPNMPDDDVPVGKSAEDNQVLERWSPKNAPVAPLVPHWDLVKKYNLVNFEEGNKIVGSGFPVYKGMGAKLQRALINFFLDQACNAGYRENVLPIIVNKNAAFGTGQLPDKEQMMYELTDPGMYLIPTAEVPLTNIYSNMTLPVEALPIKEVAYTPCFRREAGSWGRDVRGLNRLHQFDKVEIVQITRPEEAKAALAEMSQHVGALLQALMLPYRIVKLCTGDLGKSAAVTYDFEVWAPGQEKWLEVSSVSCFNNYQAARMRLFYQIGKEKKQHCYTLNGSALALPRVFAALLENQQSPSGVHIPEVLQAYVGCSKISDKR